MKKAIVGKKIGMTQVFTDDGRLVPVTVVEAGPCKVVQKKNIEKDGYEAVQVGFDVIAETRARKLVGKPQLGHFKKAGVEPARHLHELKLDNAADLEVGNELTVSQFEAGEKLDVSGISKGHGFTGTIYAGTSTPAPCRTAPSITAASGSMSANSDPPVFLRTSTCPATTAWERITVQNLELVKIDAERNLLLIKGAVPGPNGSLLIVRSAVKGA